MTRGHWLLFCTLSKQLWWRSVLQRKLFLAVRRATATLQRAARRYLQTKRRAAITLQSYARVWLAKRYLRKMEKAALVIQVQNGSEQTLLPKWTTPPPQTLLGITEDERYDRKHQISIIYMCRTVPRKPGKSRNFDLLPGKWKSWSLTIEHMVDCQFTFMSEKKEGTRFNFQTGSFEINIRGSVFCLEVDVTMKTWNRDKFLLHIPRRRWSKLGDKKSWKVMDISEGQKRSYTNLDSSYVKRKKPQFIFCATMG